MCKFKIAIRKQLLNKLSLIINLAIIEIILEREFGISDSDADLLRLEFIDRENSTKECQDLYSRELKENP